MVFCLLSYLLFSAFICVSAASPTGPETEKRFPPLRVPAGFKATLFACDPFVEYPSAIAQGPRPGTLFVAADYMTGLGTEIERRDEIRLIEDTDGDGYADKATTFAEGFNSIQGLTFDQGTVYAMHSPWLTSLRDTNGDGVADERKDLLEGLGLPPEENPVRLHCANGLVMGYDGWLYLALGDHGCDVTRPEGDKLVLHSGGILRCRADGRDLHVFSTGLRNIYDVALDDELNVFVRDNENDGGDYKIRVCHSFAGADHGYPYHYYERPDEAQAPLADLGLGSSAGGVAYLETQFPREYRGSLFFGEWGRAVVNDRLQRSPSSFGSATETEFASGADDDPYGFKPTDLIVDHDGSLLIADWADGQRPRRGRARIYRIEYVGKDGEKVVQQTPAKVPTGLDAAIRQLDSESHYARVAAQHFIEGQGPAGVALLRKSVKAGLVGPCGRMHAVWAMLHVEGVKASEELMAWATNDADPRVKVQAIRTLADLVDPRLGSKHPTQDADRERIVSQWTQWRSDELHPRELFELAVALGRSRKPVSFGWVAVFLKSPDRAMQHAVTQAMRKSQNWKEIFRRVDNLGDGILSVLRTMALRSLAEQAVPEVVDGLIERVAKETNPVRKREYADLLSRVHRKPGEWVYWGYRPAPRSANTEDWERTAAIEGALNRALETEDRATRLAILQRMLREKIPTEFKTLDRWLRDERQADRVAVLLDALREHDADEVRSLLESVVVDSRHAPESRQAAMTLFLAGLNRAGEARLLEVANQLADDEVLAVALANLGERRGLDATALLTRKLSSNIAVVRAAAIESLAARSHAAASSEIVKRLDDDDHQVRRAAAAAVGKFASRDAIPALLKLANDRDLTVRRAALDSLRLLKEPKVIPLAVAALQTADLQVVALQCLADLGGVEQLPAVVDVATRNPSPEVFLPAMKMIDGWLAKSTSETPALTRALPELHGATGTIARWNVTPPLTTVEADERVARSLSAPAQPLHKSTSMIGTGAEARITLGGGNGAGSVWLAQSDILVPEETRVQFRGGSRGAWQVWLNGQPVHKQEQIGVLRPDGDQFDATLSSGLNRVLVRVEPSNGEAAFHLRFRRKSSTVEQERFTQAALSRIGNADRGRQLFLDATKSQCIKCHRLSEQGEKICPELSGIGLRFSKIHLVESILQPSRTIAAGFQTLSLVLSDGRVLTGIKIGETDAELTLADNQGKKVTLKKADIEEQQIQPTSTMPEGLEKKLTVNEFVDLIAFLAAQRETRPK